ncbi:MAG TPA: spermidine synthase-like protein [Deltaproteobacteria bacterium]|nr:spermidine synthase-like protein [Deltaproteobacteria bacterium]
MKGYEPLSWRLLCSLGFLSSALIAYQIVLMQVLSITQWHHFAYMVISLALLGFGVSGTVLALFRTFFTTRHEVMLPMLMTITAGLMATVVRFSQHEFIRFDSFLLFSEPTQLAQLFITSFLFMLPFFTSALAIGIAFVCHAERIGMLYSANLAGSGAGGLGVIGLFWVLFPEQLPAVIALVPLGASLLLLDRRVPRSLLCLIVLSGGMVFLMLLNPPALILSEFKAARKALEIPDSAVLLRKNSPYGQIELITSPGLRYAPGLSLAFTGEVPVINGVFLNGDWIGPRLEMEEHDTAKLLAFTTKAVAYAMGERLRVLVLDAGTGADILLAIEKGTGKVHAVEENAALLGVLLQGGDGLIPHLQPTVELFIRGSRPYIASAASRHSYELIMLPDIGTFGGGSGIGALEETYLMTVEALEQMWNLLSPEGALLVSCYRDYPSRNPLRILASVVHVLKSQGMDNPREHIAAISGWASMSFIVKKSPISSREAGNIRRFCAEMLFDPLLLPDIMPEERTRYNRLMEEDLIVLFDGILAPDRGALIRGYEFDIRPITDDRPYFSQFLRFRSVPDIVQRYGRQGMPFLELGYVILVFTLVQIAVAAVILILLPLFRIGWKSERSSRVLVYFGCIGIGYMFVEIVLISKFILYFGNALYAASAVISCMLIFSGVGSLLTSRVRTGGRGALSILTTIALMILLGSVVISPLLRETMSFPVLVKGFLSLLLMGPLAVLMGMPFPLGLRAVARREEPLVPWAWGINGCLSVISAPAATLIAVEFGFSVVMWCAAGVYAAALAVSWLNRKY